MASMPYFTVHILARDGSRSSAIGAPVLASSWDYTMTTMTNAGYLAEVELDEETGLFSGEVMNIRDVLTFQGRTPEEMKKAFAETIADYVEWCRERGKEPEQPYSGNFAVSLSPELHRHIAAAAAREGKSVDAFITAALERAA